MCIRDRGGPGAETAVISPPELHAARDCGQDNSTKTTLRENEQRETNSNTTTAEIKCKVDGDPLDSYVDTRSGIYEAERNTTPSGKGEGIVSGTIRETATHPHHKRHTYMPADHHKSATHCVSNHAEACVSLPKHVPNEVGGGKMCVGQVEVGRIAKCEEENGGPSLGEGEIVMGLLQNVSDVSDDSKNVHMFVDDDVRGNPEMCYEGRLDGLAVKARTHHEGENERERMEERMGERERSPQNRLSLIHI